MDTNRWVMLDDEGKPIRFYDYPHEGAIKIEPKKHSYAELLELNGGCLL